MTRTSPSSRSRLGGGLLLACYQVTEARAASCCLAAGGGQGKYDTEPEGEGGRGANYRSLQRYFYKGYTVISPPDCPGGARRGTLRAASANQLSLTHKPPPVLWRSCPMMSVPQHPHWSPGHTLQTAGPPPPRDTPLQFQAGPTHAATPIFNTFLVSADSQFLHFQRETPEVDPPTLRLSFPVICVPAVPPQEGEGPPNRE